MSPGSTRTGGVLERMILPALEQGGYSYETQVHLGKRLGIGKHVVDAVAHRDYPVVQALVFLIAFGFVIVNLLVDLTYAWLDPRIRYQ